MPRVHARAKKATAVPRSQQKISNYFSKTDSNAYLQGDAQNTQHKISKYFVPKTANAVKEAKSEIPVVVVESLDSESELDIVQPTPQRSKPYSKRFRHRSKSKMVSPPVTPDGKKIRMGAMDSPDLIPPSPQSRRTGTRRRLAEGRHFSKLCDPSVIAIENSAFSSTPMKGSVNTYSDLSNSVNELNISNASECFLEAIEKWEKEESERNNKKPLFNALDGDKKKTKPSFSDPVEDIADDFSTQCTCSQSRLSQAELMAEEFGRHVVRGVETFGSQELQLLVEPVGEPFLRTCILKGFWQNTQVNEGDIVHIQTEWDTDQRGVVDNDQGYIVVKPDHLLAGTSVVGSVFCMRKAVLSSWYRRADGTSADMFVGTLIHRLLQEALKERQHSLPELRHILDGFLKEPGVVEDMYGLGMSRVEFRKKLDIFIPRLSDFMSEYVKGIPLQLSQEDKQKREKRAQGGHRQWDGQIVKVCDIEETIWSPRFGIKGNIDASVGVKLKRKDRSGRSGKIVPLELKTGRSSFSAEHKGQVMLYSLMMGDRREDPDGGLLLYLRDGALSEVLVEPRERRGLIQLRNEMVHYLTADPEISGDLPFLPPPILSDFACGSCPFNTVCSALNTTVPGYVSCKPLNQAIAHLSESHIAYLCHWDRLLRLEASSDRGKSAGNIWCQPPLERARKGQCITPAMLEDTILVSGENYDHVFGAGCPHAEMRKVTWERGEVIIVSTDRDVALATGTLKEVGMNTITITIDKNLGGGRYLHTIFHLDRAEFMGAAATNFGNLATLMADTPESSRLRSLVIDRTHPTFSHTMKREVVTRGGNIIKTLNKQQQRAVLKAIAAKDYVLIEGMPGTGKTSVIVALIRVLAALGKSVLLASYTHMAVDNVLLKLKEHGLLVVRMGREGRVHPELRGICSVNLTAKMSNPEELEQFYNNVQVVATTCLSMRDHVFVKRRFDYCVLDEAGQVLQASALGPLFRSQTFVLVGDAQQLPPLVQNKSARAQGMTESLFSRLQRDSNTVTLVHQYRMNRTVMSIANRLVYEEKLECGSEKVAQLRLKLLGKVEGEAEWLQEALSCRLEDAVSFLDTSQLPCGKVDGRDGIICNAQEAQIVQDIVDALHKGGIKDESVGVIAPFRAQVAVLKKVLSHRSQVEVSTVDQYQGRDKDVIVCSLTRAIKESRQRPGTETEILNDLRRWNVAFTRAKKKLICIGNASALRKYKPFEALLDILRQDQAVITLVDGQKGFAKL